MPDPLEPGTAARPPGKRPVGDEGPERIEGPGGEPAGEAEDPVLESEEGLGMTTAQLRKAGLVIDLPMEGASGDPKPLRYDDDD